MSKLLDSIFAPIIESAQKNAPAKQSGATDKHIPTDKQEQTHTHVEGGIVASGDGHAHSGESEHYEEIVGSLGEVNDEGCDDLNGVRLISHDDAYEIDTEQVDYSEIAKAIVLGEVLGMPRCKKPYGKR